MILFLSKNCFYQQFMKALDFRYLHSKVLGTYLNSSFDCHIHIHPRTEIQETLIFQVFRRAINKQVCQGLSYISSGFLLLTE